MKQLALVTALALVACGGAGDRAPNPTASGTADCAPLEFPAAQGGSHLVGGASPPVAYSSSPPTSGWHASGFVEIAVYPPERPLPEPEQVSILEAGGVVVTHGPLPAADRDMLVRHVEDRYADRVAVTPYTRLGRGRVAVAAYGVLQRCDAIDTNVIDNFVRTYAAEEPEVPGSD